MIYKNRCFCDCCGKRTKDIDLQIKMEISNGEDRCLGSSGCLDSENDLYSKCKDRDNLNEIIGDQTTIFCSDCSGDPSKFPRAFEHQVREARAKVLLKKLEKGDLFSKLSVSKISKKKRQMLRYLNRFQYLNEMFRF